MSKIVSDIRSLIGNTPLFEIVNIEKKLNLKSKVYVKLESFNPGGSIKDRASLYMIEKAIEEGYINSDTHICEATSGNTGIGIAMLCASKGLKCTIIMSEGMSEERVKILRQYGANVILTLKEKGMQGAIDELESIKKNDSNIFIPNQFENENNLYAHYMTTAREIYDACDDFDYFVCAVGTSGTIMGCSKYFKEMNKDIKVIAVEPKDSAVLSGEESNAHGIQGIGAGFVPKLFDYQYIDKIEKADYKESIESSKLLAREEGLLVGISSGASLSVALKYALKNEGKKIVVILPDDASRYFSTELFNEK